MNFINGHNIFEALSKTYRLYLCGNLGSPQNELEWIHDEKIEIGISNYSSFTADVPHVHLCATEYNYILRGASKVYIVDEEKEYVFEEGTLFVIPQNTCYGTKHREGTQMLFVKSPGGNDKKLIDIPHKLQVWLQTWE